MIRLTIYALFALAFALAATSCRLEDAEPLDDITTITGFDDSVVGTSELVSSAPTLPDTTVPTTETTLTTVLSIATDVPVEFGDESINVLAVQEKLQALGYKPGEQDGLFGKDTEDAIRAFQTQDGTLEVNGVGNTPTLIKLATATEMATTTVATTATTSTTVATTATTAASTTTTTAATSTS